MKNYLKNEKPPSIGEVYLMNFEGTGNEQRGWRPGIVLQNNKGNSYSPNIIALPLTSCLKKMGQPTHVFISSDDTDLPKDSIVLCENPKTLSKEKIGAFITKLPDDYMKKVAIGYVVATSAISFLSEEDLIKTWKNAVKLNSVA